MSASEFLLELLCEEIPANALPGAPASSCRAGSGRSCGRRAGRPATVASALDGAPPRWSSSPTGLPERQPDREEEVTGPPVRAAFANDGAPTPAAVGFARRGRACRWTQLRVAPGRQGRGPGRHVAAAGPADPEVLAEIMPAGSSARCTSRRRCAGARGEHTFVRPLHTLLAVFGADLHEVVPVELFGVASAADTRGPPRPRPRRASTSAGAAGSPPTRAAGAAGVVLDPDERAPGLRGAARAGWPPRWAARSAPTPSCWRSMVELVEHPGPAARRDRGALPRAAARRCWSPPCATTRSAWCWSARMAGWRPYFLAVCDRPDDPEGLVRRGNEWVAGARLADARVLLRRRTARRRSRRAGRALEKGSSSTRSSARSRDKTARGRRAGRRAGRADRRRRWPPASWRAPAELAQGRPADRRWSGEFAELQGVIGGIYARLDGEPEAVWHAVCDQYSRPGSRARCRAARTRPARGGRRPAGHAGRSVRRRRDAVRQQGPVRAPARRAGGGADLRRGAAAPATCTRRCGAPSRCAAAARRSGRGRRGVRVPGGARAPLPDDGRRREAEVADAVLAARWGVVPDDVARARALEAVRGGGRVRLARGRRSSGCATWSARAARGAVDPAASCSPRRPSAHCGRARGVRGRASTSASRARRLRRACAALAKLAAPLDALLHRRAGDLRRRG